MRLSRWLFMTGELRIRLDAADGKTRVIESYALAPFHYLPPRAGEPPMLTIVNSSGGVLGGDHLEMSIALGSGAHLTLRSQAATKVYRSTGACGRSVTRFTLGESALLDYLPDEIIPFADSDYEQHTEVELGRGAVAVISEIVTAGRLARAEHFDFTRLALDVRCSSGGRLLLHDRADIRPSVQHLAAPSILGDAMVWGSFYLLTTEEVADELIECVDGALHATEGGRGAASAASCGVVGRVVASSVEPARAALRAAHAGALEYFTQRRMA